MLVLMDRGFDAGDFLAAVAATKAQFLVRLTASRRPPVLGRLPDGSVLSVIGGIQVRIIEPPSRSPATTAPATAAATGWPPPSSTTAATPPPR